MRYVGSAFLANVADGVGLGDALGGENPYFDDGFFGAVTFPTKLRLIGGYTSASNYYDWSPSNRTVTKVNNVSTISDATSPATPAESPRPTAIFLNGRAGEVGFPGTQVYAQLKCTNTSDIQMRTSDWILDMLWYFPTFTPTSTFYDARWSMFGNFDSSSFTGTANLFRLYQDSDRRLKIGVTGAFDHTFGAGSVIPRDQWSWVRLKRVSNLISLEIDGASVGTSYNCAGHDYQGGDEVLIGTIESEYSQAYGYLGGLRLAIA